jgi:hypothetical protein
VKEHNPHFVLNTILPNANIGKVLSPEHQGYASTVGWVKALWGGFEGAKDLKLILLGISLASKSMLGSMWQLPFFQMCKMNNSLHSPLLTTGTTCLRLLGSCFLLASTLMLSRTLAEISAKWQIKELKNLLSVFVGRDGRIWRSQSRTLQWDGLNLIDVLWIIMPT